MSYAVLSRLEHGGFRCELDAEDLGAALTATRQRVRETQRRHYIVDRSGRLVDVVHPH
jgi:hypothetical protein